MNSSATGSHSGCLPVNCESLRLTGNSSSPEDCAYYNKGTVDTCDWDTGKQQCVDVAQHFDTMTLFVVVETLVIGIGLVLTMYQGVLANEIKKEAFPYVVRMKLSELLSNSANFVTERAIWAKHKRNWRIAEVKLLAVARKLKKIHSVKDTDVDDADETHKQDCIKLQIEAKNKALDTLEAEGLYAFLESDRMQFADADQLEVFASELRSERVVADSSEARLYAAQLLNEGCTTLDLLKSLQQVNNVGSNKWCKDNMPKDNMPPGSEWAPELSKARYPFGESANDDFTRQAKVNFEALTTTRSEPRRAPHDHGALGADPEEVVQRLLTEIRESLERLNNDSERERCVRMLKILAATLDDEYNEGGRAHWGSEVSECILRSLGTHDCSA